MVRETIVVDQNPMFSPWLVQSIPRWSETWSRPSGLSRLIGGVIPSLSHRVWPFISFQGDALSRIFRTASIHRMVRSLLRGFVGGASTFAPAWCVWMSIASRSPARVMFK
jgi:hypothetical protein